MSGLEVHAGTLTVAWGKGGVWTEAGEETGKNGSRGGGDEEAWDRAQFLGVLWNLGLKFIFLTALWPPRYEEENRM